MSTLIEEPFTRGEVTFSVSSIFFFCERKTTEESEISEKDVILFVKSSAVSVDTPEDLAYVRGVMPEDKFYKAYK